MLLKILHNNLISFKPLIHWHWIKVEFNAERTVGDEDEDEDEDEEEDEEWLILFLKQVFNKKETLVVEFVLYSKGLGVHFTSEDGNFFLRSLQNFVPDLFWDKFEALFVWIDQLFYFFVCANLGQPFPF